MESRLNLAHFLFLFSIFSITVGKLELIASHKTPCRKSSVNYNVTLSNGAKAGKYYKISSIDNMDDCVSNCCRSKRCDVAFMVNKNCYLVKCHNSDSCELKQSDNSKFDTMLSVVSKSNSKSIEGESKAGEPAIEENLQEKASGVETVEPFIQVDPGEDDMTTVTAFGTGKTKRSKRSSDIIDMVVAVGCGTVAVAVGVAGVIVMTRRLIDNSKS
ncbi:PREDICTED: uncharacterized protein LOC107341127 [Acropora digitifera]|uniref:uncharacterized protein LOC107341127 n=1 Tax=Acropora digitifera TaxID=70779 RepID=UPI00077B14CC|nr:PREDICTED: uncharacterized protein LOC107341127 [Acropora digitifera]XP_029193899.1 uncharacterized protein LOC114959896 [Acropora millepora]XP_029193900.1 uncharacterized protein LOC114959896 [Acropora millepora]XP_029193901.1 uncharacterized protein LOC114959896 [Acropora millepora]XP_029193902.1 uncharacterized protein LOC114959896 [Acropora millepora]